MLRMLNKALLNKTSATGMVQRHMSSQVEALIIGSGVAGTSTALSLAKHGRRVLMLSAAPQAEASNSFWAQGGIIYKGEDDSPDLLSQDIHSAGAGVSYDPAVRKLATEGPQRVEDLLIEVANVPFQRTDDGELSLTLEASHSRPRIVYKADHTGRAITTSLLQASRAEDRIEMRMNATVVDIAKSASGECVGAYVMDNTTNHVDFISADVTVLATGGIGDLYLNSSNPQGARADGLGIGLRAGAVARNMQYVQFHPTTLFIPNESRFLLTEALRGEGGQLINSKGRAFAKDYHPLGELAPRDVVARMILSEMDKERMMRTGSGDCMYLDISHKDAKWLQQRFPTIYAHCMDRGIDMTKDPMPVVPSEHYHCGGLEVDLNGRTSVPRLFAAGEVSCTGLHGANRLASTSLLEGLVWGCSIADTVVQDQKNGVHANSTDASVVDFKHTGVIALSESHVDALWKDLQTVMWENVGPVRTPSGLHAAVTRLEELEKHILTLYQESRVTPDTIGLRNAVLAAKSIAIAALDAPDSIGTHYLIEDSKVAVAFD